MVTIKYKGDGIPLQYGPDGKRVDNVVLTDKDKINLIRKNVTAAAERTGFNNPFHKECSIELLLLATNIELNEPLNQKGKLRLIKQSEAYSYFYNWAFMHSRKIMNIDLPEYEEGDFGMVSYLHECNRYYNFYLHLVNFDDEKEGLDGDRRELLKHILCMSGPQTTYSDYTYSQTLKKGGA